MEKKKRILIVDDNPTLRQGLGSLLSIHRNYEIAGEAGDGLEAVESVERLRPDLILMDISMPRMDGMAATREIKKKWPETKILAFTVHDSEEYIQAMLQAGADGYVLKDSIREVLIRSIENVMEGKQVLGPRVVKQLNE
jgi:DNA-binding NarL/FixJ family response regulator